MHRLVDMLQRRSHPSSWELEYRSTFAQKGHGLCGFRVSGGLGRISICVTLLAPWRMDVPTQSEPVSPPPIITTFLPVARILSSSGILHAPVHLVLLGKKIHGKMNAFQVRAFHCKCTGFHGPDGKANGIKFLQQFCPLTSYPTWVFGFKYQSLLPAEFPASGQ